MTRQWTPAAFNALMNGDIENFDVASTPGGIERQEAEGQQRFVTTDMMPLELNPDRAAFEALGFTFGEPVDDIFVNATLPPGWTKKPHESHSMWSDIYDETGKKRVSIFYKAAFYDRSAHADLPALSAFFFARAA